LGYFLPAEIIYDLINRQFSGRKCPKHENLILAGRRYEILLITLFIFTILSIIIMKKILYQMLQRMSSTISGEAIDTIAGVSAVLQ